jgi:hypothetical protein
LPQRMDPKSGFFAQVRSLHYELAFPSELSVRQVSELSSISILTRIMDYSSIMNLPDRVAMATPGHETAATLACRATWLLRKMSKVLHYICRDVEDGCLASNYDESSVVDSEASVLTCWRRYVQGAGRVACTGAARLSFRYGLLRTTDQPSNADNHLGPDFSSCILMTLQHVSRVPSVSFNPRKSA